MLRSALKRIGGLLFGVTNNAAGGTVTFDKNLARKLIQGKPWRHDFEILPGVRTNGAYDPVPLWNELRLPQDMTGISLADVGASNGYFSFEARKRGVRVVAFDLVGAIH